MNTKTIHHPFGFFTDFDSGFSRIVSDLLQDTPNGYRPALSIVEHGDRFVIECDLPGLSLNDITLEVDDGVLEISGERRASELPEGSVVRFNERVGNTFKRRVRLDKSVDVNAIAADYQDGVLIVTAPRLPETRPRKVEIRRVEQS